MKDSERLRWEADQIKWNSEALKRALAAQPRFPGAGASTSSSVVATPPPPVTLEDIALAAYRKSQLLKQKAVGAERKEKSDRREEYRRRGKANQAAGSRWEGIVLQFFKKLGYTAYRVEEKHGYTKGWDIALKELPGLVIQCKSTQTKAALLNGLDEARTANPREIGWVCFHRFRVKKAKKGEHYTYMVAYSSRPPGPVSITDLESFYHMMENKPGEYPGG